jgi:hypothetical protein
MTLPVDFPSLRPFPSDSVIDHPDSDLPTTAEARAGRKAPYDWEREAAYSADEEELIGERLKGLGYIE